MKGVVEGWGPCWVELVSLELLLSDGVDALEFIPGDEDWVVVDVLGGGVVGIGHMEGVCLGCWGDWSRVSGLEVLGVVIGVDTQIDQLGMFI